MSINYGWEKLFTAVHSLAGTGTQKDRLAAAVVYSLVHIKPEENLPPTMRDEFTKFLKEMTAVDAVGDEGSVKATVNSFDETRVQDAIDKILGFFDAICRHRKPN